MTLSNALCLIDVCSGMLVLGLSVRFNSVSKVRLASRGKADLMQTLRLSW